MAETFHGTVIAVSIDLQTQHMEKALTDRKWARRYGMFGLRSESIDSLRDEARLHPKTAWVSWIRKEEQKRYE